LRGTELRKLMSEDSEIGFHVLERLCFLLKDRVQAAYGALEKI
jgi:CRP/FNR family transcriptional regulator, cyclic AMP receptor protein